MKKSVSLSVMCLLFSLSLLSCHIEIYGNDDRGNNKTVKGSGTILSEIIPISDYNELSIGAAKVLVYEQKEDSEPYLRIEVDENIYPFLIVETKGKALSIRSEKNIDIKPTKYAIYTNSSELAKLAIAGSTDAQLKGNIETKQMRISIAGNSHVKGDNIVCESLNAEIAGSGKITLAGQADNSNYSIAGSGRINTTDMPVKNVKCEIAGSGNIQTNATEDLKVSIAGAGTVLYKGNPKVKKSVAGVGKIESI